MKRCHEIALQGAVMDYLRRLYANDLYEALSPREREVMLLTMNGLTNKEAGARLGLSAGTVHWHLVNAFRKLHVHSKEEARRTFSPGCT